MNENIIIAGIKRNKYERAENPLLLLPFATFSLLLSVYKKEIIHSALIGCDRIKGNKAKRMENT